MRNHALLYLLRADGHPGEFDALGESNSLFPLLWRALFAVPVQADCQDVLERNVLEYLAADAQSALARVKRLIAWLRQQPEVLASLDVQRYLHATETHLLDRVEQWLSAEAEPTLFYVCLDEFEQSAAEVRSASEQWWRTYLQAEAAGDSVAMLFASVSGRNAVEEWRTWAEAFGFALFAEPYFADAFRRPASVDYSIGSAVVEPVRWPLSNGLAVVLEADHYGYIDAQGRIVAEPQFDLADDFTEHGVARICKRRRYGLLRADGSYAFPPAFDALDWRADLGGWLGRNSSRELVLLHADGSPHLSDAWTHIEALGSRWLRVGRGEFFGVLQRSGAIALPCRFRRIEALETHQGAAPHDRYVRVTEQAAGSRPKVGVWDLERGESVVPCEYDFIVYVDAAHGRFLVANKLPYSRGSRSPRYRVGVLDVNGAALVPLDYTWIGVPADLSKRGAPERAVEAVHWSWSRGEPVAAGLPDAHCVFIQVDGTVLCSGALRERSC